MAVEDAELLYPSLWVVRLYSPEGLSSDWGPMGRFFRHCAEIGVEMDEVMEPKLVAGARAGSEMVVERGDTSIKTWDCMWRRGWTPL